MRLVLTVAFVALGAAQPAPVPPCEPAACVDRISTEVAVSVAKAGAADIAGLWKSGSGLSGENLYLFADGSCIYTEWADLLPETIYDKGLWRIDDGVVQLSRDAQVSWDPESDRRFIALTVSSSDGKPMLLGLDGSLRRFLELATEHPDTGSREWLRLCALHRERPIAARETSALTGRPSARTRLASRLLRGLRQRRSKEALRTAGRRR